MRNDSTAEWRKAEVSVKVDYELAQLRGSIPRLCQPMNGGMDAIYKTGGMGWGLQDA